MTPVDDRILKRIEGLLNRTVENGCSENEAASAAILAQRLLLEHGISMEAVQSLQDKAEDIVKEGQFTSTEHMHKGQWEWQKELAIAVSECTCTKLLIQKTNYLFFVFFVGTQTNIAIAQKLYLWLANQMFEIAVRERTNAYRNRGKEGHSSYLGKNYLRSFLLGMTGRVCYRLREEFKEQVREANAGKYIIEKYDAAQAYIDSLNLKNFKEKSNAEVNWKGLEHGKKASEQVKIRHEEALNTGVPKALL